MESFWLAMSEPPELPRSKIRSTRAVVSGRARSRATRRRKYSARDTPRSLARWRARRCISVSSVIWVLAIIMAPSYHTTPFCRHRISIADLESHIRSAASFCSRASSGVESAKILSKLVSVEGLRNLPEQLDWLLVAREGWFCVVLENMENGRDCSCSRLVVYNQQAREKSGRRTMAV